MNKSIGQKMFKGAAIGAGVGAVGGGIYGGIKANQEIQKVPVDSIELRSYEKPVYEYKYFERGKSADFPLKNPDGSFKMETVPSETVSGHGKPVLYEVKHPIQEPVRVRTYTRKKHSYEVGIGDYKTEKKVVYETTGSWEEPRVRFDHGVNVIGYVLGYAAAGAVLGGIGGALINLAIEGAG